VTINEEAAHGGAGEIVAKVGVWVIKALPHAADNDSARRATVASLITGKRPPPILGNESAFLAA
jgi:hypothetical protein